MSSHEQAIVCLLSNFALAYATVGMIVKLTSGSSALRKLQDAPSVRVSDLWSVLFVEGGSDLKPDLSTWSGMEDLVIVLGLMEAKSAVKGGTWKSLRRNVLVSQDFGDRAMIVQRTQTMSVQEYQVDSIMMDLLERAGCGSARWMPYGFPLKEELRSRLNGQPFTYPSCKLRMGDVVELTPALPDKSLTEYREEIQHIYNRGPTVSSIGPAASTVVG